MEFFTQRQYRGPLKAAIFDWAGTTIDYGCCAPAGTFQDLFRRNGIEATIAQAREPMGMHKRDHIATMLAMPEIARQWEAEHGSPHTDEDVIRLFEAFIPLQLKALPNFLDIIPGIVNTVDTMRARGMKIGATTGYNEEMMGLCQEAATKEGYVPDVSIAVTQVPAGRPAPWMAVKAAMELQVFPWESIVKIGDTVTDVLEGLNAGMWTIALTKQGNEVGLSRAAVEGMAPDELAPRIERATQKLAQAGAHYVVESVSDIPPLLDTIEERLARGERP
jgi:phosphonoacetaldehyde hydrolase